MHTRTIIVVSPFFKLRKSCNESYSLLPEDLYWVCKPQIINDWLGTLAELAGRPSAWTRIREVLPDRVVAPPEHPQTQVTEHKGGPAQDAVSAIGGSKFTIMSGGSAAVGDAASRYKDAYTDEQMAKMRGPAVFLDQKNGIIENKDTFELVDYGTKSLGQTVIYKSRFVERLSEITDDMNITGAISIKANMLGGSGRGAYIDTNKFEQSDLNFYISVKVVNQSVNFKDALMYNTSPSTRLTHPISTMCTVIPSSPASWKAASSLRLSP